MCQTSEFMWHYGKIRVNDKVKENDIVMYGDTWEDDAVTGRRELKAITRSNAGYD